MKVFFYGLFMDVNVLANKGITPFGVKVGFLDGYALRIGERATLLRSPDSRAYGVMMEITSAEVTKLYADESVADYVPEPVTVDLLDGARTEAACYNLPASKVTGTNRDYAESLLDLATKLNFPESYLKQIKQTQI